MGPRAEKPQRFSLVGPGALELNPGYPPTFKGENTLSSLKYLKNYLQFLNEKKIIFMSSSWVKLLLKKVFHGK